MLKLVVLSLVAAAVAEPSALFYSSPLTYSTVLAPASTTITKSASSVVHPSPVYSAYAAPLAYSSHFIKKRSPQYYPYYAPSGPLIASLPYTTPLFSTPVVNPAVLPYSAASLPLAATHFIKKRSAPLLTTRAIIAPTSYVAAPLLTSTYAATTPVFSSPFYSSPIAYSAPVTHFIKKRSAPFLTTYLAPTSYSHQSRFDLINHPSPILKVASYHAPLNFPVLV